MGPQGGAGPLALCPHTAPELSVTARPAPTASAPSRLPLQMSRHCRPPGLLDSGLQGTAVSQGWHSHKAPIPPCPAPCSQCPAGVWLDRGTQEVGRSLALLPTMPQAGRDSGELAVCPRPGCPVACPLGGRGRSRVPGSGQHQALGQMWEYGLSMCPSSSGPAVSRPSRKSRGPPWPE